MAVFCEFFEHSNFAGDSVSYIADNDWRYHWVKFGSDLGNEITSLRANAYSGTGGNVYGFSERDFLGSFASLNMAQGWTCWWSNVGGAMNDDIESALLVNRNSNELRIGMAEQITDPFIEGLDEEIEDTQVSRQGNPRIYSVFWPSYDPTRKFVRIEQDLRVELDWWFDYDAQVQYDIYLFLDDNGAVNGNVAATNCWVEGGIFSGGILDDLCPRLEAGAETLTEQLQDQLAVVNFLAALGGYNFTRLYLLPGSDPVMPPPSTNFGRIGNATEDSTLVLAY
ncbi:MAG: hypothetical protein QF797_12960 [Alphaproteobacteria bacterium]|nr:hypothetical protein [Rhodospirillaceae bacterium]MDP6406109.1 hypothetical protein [Alphaproteobacteria bacterium]MDP6621082.1 hypothetical protein [Alphaproteobacteria bacterium]|tara:strand:+ start:75 stop:917 length:843 start_codon:yes stop_codon:yes gene_type:complete